MRVLSALLAGVALVAAWLISQDLASAGFPDGYLTEYDQASRLPWTVCAWGSLAVAAWSVYLGGFAPPEGLKRRTLLSVFLYVCFMVLATYAIPYYFIDHLGLDHGQGG